MEYSKSVIREKKKRIEYELKRIGQYLPEIDNTWVSWHMILSALVALKSVLDPLKTHIIDNDDYSLAIEINGMLTPVWNDYCDCAIGDVSLKHQEAYEFQDVIDDLRAWIKEYETAHPCEQKTLTDDSSMKAAGAEIPTKALFDVDKLKTLFVDSFFKKDYAVKETSSADIKQSRFDKLCDRLEMTLTDKDRTVTDKVMGGIAYMIYHSKYIKSEYGKPKGAGKKGKFAPLLRLLFEIVGMEKPRETSPNKYKPLDEEKLLFEDVLKFEQ